MLSLIWHQYKNVGDTKLKQTTVIAMLTRQTHYCKLYFCSDRHLMLTLINTVYLAMLLCFCITELAYFPSRMISALLSYFRQVLFYILWCPLHFKVHLLICCKSISCYVSSTNSVFISLHFFSFFFLLNCIE